MSDEMPVLQPIVSERHRSPEFRLYKQPASYCVGCNSYRIMACPMSLVVFGLVALTYIPYVTMTPHHGIGGVLEMICFHFIIAMLLVSYIQCALVDAGTVPKEWHDMVIQNDALQNMFPRCRRCNMFKPPRSHFDSVTQRLVLNFDHFCPWVVNSVGFYNRKFFVLFLLYTWLACVWYVAASVVRMVITHQSISGAASLMHFMAFVVDMVLSLSLSCFLGFHVKLVLNNETTIEESAPQYDMGWRHNVEQVFGRNRLLWLIPVFGEGPVWDGVYWPTRTPEGHDVENAHSDPVEQGFDDHEVEMEDVAADNNHARQRSDSDRPDDRLLA
jgi:hypothetical protein